MKLPSAVLRFALALTVFSGSLAAMAEDWDLAGLPPIKVEKVFVSKIDRKFYVLIGSAPGGTFALFSQNGKVRAPRQGRNSMAYYDGGSLDLNFESGERVMIPSTIHTPKGRAHSLGSNYLKTSSTPRIASPTMAPQELMPVKIDEALLERTGFDIFIAKQEPKTARVPSERVRETLVENAEEFVPVILAFSEDADYTVQRSLSTDLQQLPPEDFRVIDREGSQTLFGSYSFLVVMARKNRVDEIQNRASVRELVEKKELSIELPLREIANAKPYKISSKVEASLVKLESRKGGETLANRYRIFQAIEAMDFSKASDELKVNVARSITGFLGDVESLHAREEYFITYQTAIADGMKGMKNAYVGTFTNARRRESHVAVPTLLTPLREIGQRGYEVIHSLKIRLGTEIITEAAGTLHGAGVSFFDRKVKGSNKTYFQAYFDNLRAALNLADLLPSPGADREIMKERQLQISMSGGGMFENMPISGDMRSVRSYAPENFFFRLGDQTSRAPLALLGRRGDKAKLKNEVMQFIVDGDKRSYEMALRITRETKLEQYQRVGLTPEAAAEFNRTYTLSPATFESLKSLPRNGYLEQIGIEEYIKHVRQELKQTPESPDVKGSQQMIDFIKGIRFYPKTDGLPNFSRAEYDRSIMEIYTDLLEHSRVVLTNEGVYVALMDSAMESVKDFERRTGLRNRAYSAAAVAALRLQNEIQKQLLRGWSNTPDKVLNTNVEPPARIRCEALFGG